MTPQKNTQTPCAPNRLPWLLCGVLLVILGLVTYYSWSTGRLDVAQNMVTDTWGTSFTYEQESFGDGNELVLPEEEKFLTLKEQYIEDRKTFVEADLQAMKLTFFKEGTSTQTFDILTKGKEGSWWETPTGDYTILNKNPNGYSTIGKVWMPYSMQFYGNYLVHGWPYYEDGTEVSSSYSGGCIRLSTHDAGILFDLVSVGTPILVLDEPKLETQKSLSLVGKDGVVPAVTAQSFIVTNIQTGETLLEKQSTVKRPVASITKLMTAIVAHETIYLGRDIRVNPDMVKHETPGFKPVVGAYYNGLDLLYPLLMQSSNDTAEILSLAGGNTRFVKNMNIKAQALKMQDTTFADASGLSPENISTAADVAKLLGHIYYKRPFIFDVTKGKTFLHVGALNLGATIDITTLKNYNELVTEASLVGVKNGETLAAGQTMGSVWYLGEGEDVVPVSIVVLGSTDRARDTQSIIAWVREHYMVSH
jgi:D-alanyl-D-alanine carboxypeptidase